MVQPAGTVDEPFAAVWKSISVRSERASRTAPSIFNAPAPCSKVLAPETGRAEYCMIILIIPGVRFGLTCSKSAAAPATTGADIDVPLMYIIESLSFVRSSDSDGLSNAIRLLGAL